MIGIQKQKQIDLIKSEIARLNKELDHHESTPPVPQKKIEVEALPNGYLLGIETKSPGRTELFLSHKEGKDLVKDLLLGCDDGMFILSPFSQDLASVISDIGKAFG